jgi:hypothetical protein
MIVVDVVDVRIEPPNSLCDALVPGGVVNTTFKVVHARWIRFRFCTLSEDWRVQENVGDVTSNVAIHEDCVVLSKNLDIHPLRCSAYETLDQRMSPTMKKMKLTLIEGIVNAAHARDNPNEILVS